MKSIRDKLPETIRTESYGRPEEGEHASVALLGCFGEWAGPAGRREMF